MAAVFVESGPDETEPRLLSALRRRCPDLPADADLVASLALLRRGKHLPQGKKVLLVLDQFEQWLHARRDEPAPAMVLALRQCDGEHLQALVLVRDDFWMATTRLLRAVEAPLVEGTNSAAVELFEKTYGIEVTVLRGDAVELAARLISEAQAGRVAADVFDGTANAPALKLLEIAQGEQADEEPAALGRADR